jgi:hypothetical protein
LMELAGLCVAQVSVNNYDKKWQSYDADPGGQYTMYLDL